MAPVTDAHGIDLTSTVNRDRYAGIQIETNAAVKLQKVTKDSDDDATKCYLYSDNGSDQTGNLLDTQDFVGDEATFSYDLADATKYWILVNAEGAAYDNAYQAYSGYPFLETNVDFTLGVTFALVAPEYLSTHIFAIESVTTDAAVGTNTQVNIGDALKEIVAMKINIGDVWKDVNAMKINIGDVWKDVF